MSYHHEIIFLGEHHLLFVMMLLYCAFMKCNFYGTLCDVLLRYCVLAVVFLPVCSFIKATCPGTADANELPANSDGGYFN